MVTQCLLAAEQCVELPVCVRVCKLSRVERALSCVYVFLHDCVLVTVHLCLCRLCTETADRVRTYCIFILYVVSCLYAVLITDRTRGWHRDNFIVC